MKPLSFPTEEKAASTSNSKDASQRVAASTSNRSRLTKTKLFPATIPSSLHVIASQNGDVNIQEHPDGVELGKKISQIPGDTLENYFGGRVEQNRHHLKQKSLVPSRTRFPKSKRGRGRVPLKNPKRKRRKRNGTGFSQLYSFRSGGMFLKHQIHTAGTQFSNLLCPRTETRSRRSKPLNHNHFRNDRPTRFPR
ncbi:hypothetical protein H6P81_019300 [Aristolochia fimbriata]|uniref:Uncharacterized protein n=1 Tax=Aristolochia fimbriata TaxID=158543 RepID=A0AAV7DSU0_ARIFI|nr:hypothetical protein H6P81_019300 [Aristolochia fimbriata]